MTHISPRLYWLWYYTTYIQNKHHKEMGVCQSCANFQETDFGIYKRMGYNFGFSNVYWWYNIFNFFFISLKLLNFQERRLFCIFSEIKAHADVSCEFRNVIQTSRIFANSSSITYIPQSPCSETVILISAITVYCWSAHLREWSRHCF